ncbi:MAG: hypothetical protein HYU27_04380 [Acidobacteria bacterium]|nr:hypothetical protein [Acidobacteriota bacterium]
MAAHQTNVAMSRSVPLELDAGAEIVLKVQVSCPDGCDLRGMPVQVLAGDQVFIASELATYGEAINETEDFVLNAPGQVGEHAWSILFPRHEAEGAVHEESCLVVSFKTRPHPASMAVWAVPSPVVMNRSFKVKAGVKCSAGCPLAGQLVEVRDEAGTPIGSGRLGETPWPETSALYVAEVELAAPATEGMRAWTARFAAAELELPHEEASATFSFRIALPAEHRVTVKVTDKETEAPLENVEVSLGVYRASTDVEGLAGLELPGGVYDLEAWKAGYETLPRIVEVTKDLVIQVEASFSPETDPDDLRVWM